MDVQKNEKLMKPVPKNRQTVCWRNAIVILYCHLAALYTLVALRPLWYTTIYNTILFHYVMLSTTGGVHRLWTHRTYSATWPLKLFFAVGQTMALQFSIYKWVFYHRLHHKYTDTHADPHNSKRGLFYCQLGWFMVRLHEDVLNKWKTIDMSDMENEVIVRWQRKFFPVLGPVFCFVIPTLVPHYCWGESLWTAGNCSILRFILTTHVAGLVNSVGHAWGVRPYDKNLSATEMPLVAHMTLGEGWHNYHHAFPWDYKASELGRYSLNITTAFLDLCGKLGLASDFKVATPEMIKKRISRTGDGSQNVHNQEGEVLGWGDSSMGEEDKKLIKIINQRMVST